MKSWFTLSKEEIKEMSREARFGCQVSESFRPMPEKKQRRAVGTEGWREIWRNVSGGVLGTANGNMGMFMNLHWKVRDRFWGKV